MLNCNFCFFTALDITAFRFSISKWIFFSTQRICSKLTRLSQPKGTNDCTVDIKFQINFAIKLHSRSRDWIKGHVARPFGLMLLEGKDGSGLCVNNIRLIFCHKHWFWLKSEKETLNWLRYNTVLSVKRKPLSWITTDLWKWTLILIRVLENAMKWFKYKYVFLYEKIVDYGGMNTVW